MTSKMERKLCALADANFKRDPGSRLKKLGEEFGELVQAVIDGDASKVSEEAADCTFVLMDINHLFGCRSMSSAQEKKWRVLMVRQRNGLLHKADRTALEAHLRKLKAIRFSKEARRVRNLARRGYQEAP